MSFEPIRVTNKGKQLLAKAVAGETLTFTRLKMGDGQLTTQVIEAMTDVIHEVISIKPNKPTIGDKYTNITGNFRNAAVEDIFIGDGATTAFKLSATPTSLVSVKINGAEEKSYTYASGIVTFTSAPAQDAEIKTTFNLDGFYWREAAVFAMDPDEGEIMFAYQNAHTLAEYIKSASSGIIEKVIGASFIISSDINVTVSVDESLVFMSLAQGQYKTELLDEETSVPLAGYIPVYDIAEKKNVKVPIQQIAKFDIDCGTWEETPVTLHNSSAMAHVNLNADGNANGVASAGDELATHETDPNAHPNIILDGNNN